MKTLILALLLAGSVHAFADDGGIYGWDIKCTSDKISLRASQSDDDFYINYKISKDNSSAEVWADTIPNFDSRLKTLLFVIDDPSHKGALSITRDQAKGFGKAAGTLVLDREMYPVSCYVRYATSEDGFDALIKKPFPK